ncbi:MAG: RNA polymerase sporulation sigma factor SigH [Lachnospiraceae bacterium]|nr:RNA polymerase sporulation sigma factor SigH [Lachnospiraceae bacterium]
MNPEKYEELTDVELIIRSREGQSDITDYLMEKYKDLVKVKARSMYILGADNDDLIQEGMIGLFKAIRDYDAGRDASFYTFAELCISRQIYTAVQASRRQKHIPLNNYISLYGNVSENADDDERYLIDALQPTGDQSPEELVIDRENMSVLEQRIEESLSSFEKQVLDLYVTGMSYVQIAKVLGRDEKSTDNALQRLKGKIRKIIKEEGK